MNLNCLKEQALLKALKAGLALDYLAGLADQAQLVYQAQRQAQSLALPA